MNTLVIGCGYLGGRIAAQLRASGNEVSATSRRPDRLTAVRGLGVRGFILDLDRPDDSAVFETRFDTIVYCVAPQAKDDPAIACRDGVSACLAGWRDHPPERFVFVSSTGIYNQQHGEWIDEESPVDPRTERQQLIVAGEQLVLRAAEAGHFPGIVLRCGGLYGPGRSPLDWCRDEARRDGLAQGTAEAFMNWIHVDDAATCVALAASRGGPGEVYLAVDDEPVRRRDFYDFACACAGVDPLDLRTDPANLAKRCSNRKARERLGFEPRYPTYREGLRALTGPG